MKLRKFIEKLIEINEKYPDAEVLADAGSILVFTNNEDKDIFFFEPEI